MQIKFDLNNLLFYGVRATASQRASSVRCRRWRLWLAYTIKNITQALRLWFGGYC